MEDNLKAIDKDDEDNIGAWYNYLQSQQAS